MIEPDLKLILAGDSEVWDVAYPWLYPTAYAVARNKLINPPAADYPADVDEVASESIARLAQRVPELDPPPGKVTELKSLLARITDNKASDFLKKKRAQKRPTEKPFTIDEETGQTIEPPDKTDTIGKLSERDMVRLIGELAKQLKPIEMDVYEDFLKLGLKHREISEKRGIPIGSVGVHIKNIHEKLRKMLRKLGIDFFYKNS
jgi:RNA polymerase sigma factor (sigma-70 family)